MTQEDKQLLLQDLCGRLPYGVKCQFEHTIRIIDRESSPFYDYVLSAHHLDLFMRHNNFYIKPYLRPMSSMTEEERKSLPFPWNFDGINITSYTKENGFIEIQQTDIIELTDWLNKKMFDFRELIPKDLALSIEEYNPYKVL